MSNTALIGKSKELYVATILVARNLHVYFPLVDNGFDLLVTSSDARIHIPVQVKYKRARTGFTLDARDAEKFRFAKAVLAFGSGDAKDPKVENFYFIPASDWCKKIGWSEMTGFKVLRADNRLAIYLREDQKWAEGYLGEKGIERSFKRVLENA